MEKHLFVIQNFSSIPIPKDNVYTNLLNGDYITEADSVCSVVLCVLDNVTSCLLLIPWPDYDTFKLYAKVGGTLCTIDDKEITSECALNDILVHYISQKGGDFRMLGTCIIGTEREIKKAYLELCLMKK